MNHLKLIYYILFISLYTPYSYSTSSFHTFKQISVFEGLSQATAYSICQDSLGYIWIGTQDGLNKYNGHNIITYESDIQDTTTLHSSYVRSLLVDHENNIWIGGPLGISKYSYQQDCFKRYKLPNINTNSEINNICSDKEHLWICSQNGEIYKYNKEKDLFTSVTYHSSTNKRISILKLKSINEYLYICSFDGFYRLNKHTLQLEPLFIKESYSEAHDFIFDKNHEIWLGTKEQGLIHLDKEFNFIEQFTHSKTSNSIASNKVRALNIDQTGKIFIGTFFGLSIFDPTTNSFHNPPSSPYILSPLKSSILTIFIDKDYGIWVATAPGGINYYHPNNNRFIHKNHTTQPFSLINDVICCITQQKNHIWIGYNNNGIGCFNTHTNKMEHFATDKQGNPISTYKNIRTILPLSDGSLLLGSLFGGLIHFNPQTRQMKTYCKNKKQKHSLKDDRVSTLYSDSKGNIWVGTYDGLFKFDIKTSCFYSFEELYPFLALSSKDIYCIIEDHRKRLWIGTTDGLNRYDPDKKRLDIFLPTAQDSTSISSNKINTIYEDSQNQIWIGTPKGLNKFQEESNTFTHLTSKKGFINHTILSIIEDNNGYLWVANNKGITKVNPKTYECESFTKEDGLKSGQLVSQAVIKLPNGTLMFGGTNGITSFDPQKITSNTINKKIIFSDLYIGEQRIRPHDNTNILSNHIAQTKSIKLKYNQRNFSIFFSAINFNQQSFIYQYKLEKYTPTWVTTDKNNISFFNLHEGKYTLFVKVLPLNNIGNEQYTSMNIIISPPWWRTSWMYFIYICIFCLTTYLTYLKIQKRIQRKNEHFANIIENKKLKEFQQMRQQLFINISHELKTPLSLILSPLEELHRQISIDMRTRAYIDTAYTSSRQLNELINQLINFSKTEENDIKLVIKKGNLNELLHKIYTSFKSIANTKKIKYDFTFTEEPDNIFFDSYVMERILTNLLSNAFKFTPSKGTIRVALTYQTESCSISVTDTGYGIPKDKIEHIFDRYYTSQSNIGGSGIGLAFVQHLITLHKGKITVQSEEGKGTTFVVKIPTNLPLTYQDALPIKDKKRLVVDTAPPKANTTVLNSKILIVDDNINMAKYLQNYYAQTNDVRIAYNGSEAEEILSNNNFDLIISDVMMPDIDGFTLCRNVKQNKATSSIFFILLTVLDDAEFIIKGISYGADDYITKPFSLQVLDAKINKLKEGKKRPRNAVDSTKLIYTSLEQEFIKKMTDIINCHIEDTEYKVKDLAKDLCMSSSKLNKKCIEITGKSPTDFIKKMRLERARILLESQKYSVSEIGYMVGFTTPNYFSICFKKEFGYSPNSYLPTKNKDIP